ncbi:amino acid adenylation domain-containing protein [Paenibacillus donghaensis]|uniref:non-ribosomal peptide synthetase n=1 Tax=Paenibacillus donghaensis TaxID=414771 RepID=UPI001883C437|nr:non-ribosomal peptide synthetase [Paenibacillus donghaensis]MBE9913477.1 amino acid adenylation domain-containing protein [Paenibacillus donghaensis]
MIDDELYLKLLRDKGIRIPNKQGISGSGRKGPFDLSDAQRGIWFLQQLHPESTAFNNGTALKITGKLNVESVRIAIAMILDRHEILNVNIVADQGVPRAIPRERTPDFTYLPLEEGIQSAEDPAVFDIVTRLAARKMNLDSDPLISFTLLRIREDEHVLVIAMHHIISDGWSKSVLLGEFVQLYEEAILNKPSQMQPLSLQYRDYVDWLHQQYGQSKFESDLQFWQDKLHGAPPLLELPTDYSRGTEMSGRGRIEYFQLDEELYDKVQLFCRQEQITAYTFLLTVFKTLLHRYSAAEDLLVGTPVAGRPRTELEGLIGMFVNSVVIRSKPCGSLAFSEYLGQVHREALLAFNYQHVPFDRIVERLNPAREQSYHPVFQTMFQMDNIPVPQMEVGDIRLSVIPVDAGFSQNDLTVSCWEERTKLKGTFEFSTDLFTSATIRRWISSFIQLIRSVLADPKEVLERHAVLDDEHYRMLIHEWNATESPEPQIHFIRRIGQMMQDNPELCAILEGETSISYGELEAKVQRISRQLLSKKDSCQKPVVVCLPSSTRYVAACLAISHTGGIVVPVDPGQPKERIHAILNELGIYYIITEARYARELSLTGTNCITLDDIETTTSETQALQGEKWGANELSGGADADGLAYIVFTSGTTGVPKGVMLEHRSIDNLVHSFISSYKVEKADRMLPVTSVASSSFIGESLPILAAGGTLVLPERDTLLHPARLNQYMEKHQVTILSTVPSMLRRLNDEGGAPATLRLILSGGENLLPAHVDHLKGIPIVNGYGLSESGVCSTYSTFKSDSEDFRRAASSLGRPVANQQVYVLDHLLQPVPIGVRGQICISGRGLARGYLNRPDLTHRKFTDHPFLPGEKLLLTGDYGSWTTSGELTFAGREDRQVQIRGYRIELDEVESHLNACPEIAEAVVHPKPDHEGNLQLVAYYTLRIPRSFAAEQLSTWLEARVPIYMKPSAYIEMESIPWNLNGKLNTVALPDPVKAGERLSTVYDKPVTATEKQIAHVWKEVLHTDSFGVTDNFFDLGGHSLLLAKVLDRLNQQFDDRLTLISLFKYPTVRSLAAYLNEEQEDPSTATIQEKAEKQKNAFRRYRKVTSAAAAVSTEIEGGRS